MCAHFIWNLVFLCLSACVCASVHENVLNVIQPERITKWDGSLVTPHWCYSCRKTYALSIQRALCRSLSHSHSRDCIVFIELSFAHTHTLRARKKTEAKIIIRRNESMSWRCIECQRKLWIECPLFEFISRWQNMHLHGLAFVYVRKLCFLFCAVPWMPFIRKMFWNMAGWWWKMCDYIIVWCHGAATFLTHSLTRAHSADAIHFKLKFYLIKFMQQTS